MAASKKKAKPKDKIKPVAKVPKAVPKSVKASLAKPAKAKSGKSLPAKSAIRGAASKAVPKKNAPRPAKPSAKKVLASKKGKSTPLAKPPVAKAKPVKPGKPGPTPAIPVSTPKEPAKPQSKKDLKVPMSADKPVEKPVASPRPVRPQVVITKPRPSLRQILPPPPPPPAPKLEVRKPATPAAIRAFEQAVKAFNRRQFEEAKELFEHLHQKFPQEAELLSRSQMYLQVCQQKLAAAPIAAPARNVSADELYDRGVYALNIGDFAQARSFFEKALRLNPNEPHFLYSLAATFAQTGSLEQALDYLRRSIQIQPRFRSQAFDDADFSGLRENRQFQELLGLTSPFDLLDARR